MTKNQGFAADVGLGIGLRNQHFDHILAERPKTDWFEAISENFMDSGGRPRAVLHRIAEHYPIVLHGVSLSIGGTDSLDFGYLTRLRQLADEISALWISDHLCWTGVLGINSHDLLPLPLDEITLDHVIGRVHQVQDALSRPLVLENPSTYLRFRRSNISEPEFLRALCRATGCKLLLDVNNVYVSCFNAGSDPLDYLADFPFSEVVQLHLAGHQNCGSHIVDSHDRPVCDEVWQLFRLAWRRCGGAPTLLEWDSAVPAYQVLEAELLKARAFIADEAPMAAFGHTQKAAEGEVLSNPLDFLLPDVMGHSDFGAP